jgi:hypothetical protein
MWDNSLVIVVHCVLCEVWTEAEERVKLLRKQSGLIIICKYRRLRDKYKKWYISIKINCISVGKTRRKHTGFVQGCPIRGPPVCVMRSAATFVNYARIYIYIYICRGPGPSRAVAPQMMMMMIYIYYKNATKILAVRYTTYCSFY